MAEPWPENFFRLSLIGGEDGLVDFRGLFLEPDEQGRAEIEADFGVVVDDLLDVPFAVENARGGIGGVALGGDALVPVVVRVGGILEFDGFEPGIFPRRLVEVAVDADVAIHDWTTPVFL